MGGRGTDELSTPGDRAMTPYQTDVMSDQAYTDTTSDYIITHLSVFGMWRRVERAAGE